jgi:hypothetical protein
MASTSCPSAVGSLLNVDTAHRYPRVSVGGEKRYLHALVAEAWHGPRPDGLLVLHYDDDPDNPSAENIQWGTRRERCRRETESGKRMTTARLTLDQASQHPYDRPSRPSAQRWGPVRVGVSAVITVDCQG